MRDGTTASRNTKAGVSLASVTLWVLLLAVSGIADITRDDSKTTLAFALLAVSVIGVVFGLVGGTTEHRGKTLAFVGAGVSLVMFLASLALVVSYVS